MLIKFIKKHYWNMRLNMYLNRDEYGHIGYMTEGINDPVERQKAYDDIERDINKKIAYYEKKIKENS